MAEGRLEEILGRSVNSTKELKQAIVDLQNGIKNLGADEAALNKVNSQLNAAQEEYNRVVSAGKQATDYAKDSIVGMEKEYKNLYSTYKMLSEEQRNSDFGKGMAESLNNLSTKLNDTKKNVGDFKSNIGRYSQGVMDAFNQMGVSVGALQGPMKLAAGGANTLGASLKALIANPVGAVIMGIVVAFKALGLILDQVKKAINSNEESQMRLKEAMSAFQPIIDKVKNAFDKLGQGVVTFVEKIGDSVNKVRLAKAALTDFLHITKGAKEEVEAEIESYKGLSAAQNDLTKKTREYNEANATDKSKVEDLRNQAAETTDVEEKIRLLNEAKEIQAQIDERNIELAKENLRILEEEAEKTANDAAANEKLSKAKQDVANATAAANANAKTFNKQLTTLTSSTKSHTSALDKQKEKLKEVLERLEENNKTEVQKITEKYEEEKKLLEKYHKDTTELTKEYNDKITKINEAAERERLEKEEALRQQRRKAQIEYNSKVEAYNESISHINVANDAKDEAERNLKVYEEYFNKIMARLQYNLKNFGIDSIDQYTTEQLKKLLTDAEFTAEVINKAGTSSMLSAIDGKDITSLLDLKGILLDLKVQAKEAAKTYYDAFINYFTLQKNDELSVMDLLGAGSMTTDELFDHIEERQAIEEKYNGLILGLMQQELDNFKGSEEEKMQLEVEFNNFKLELAQATSEKLAALDELRMERNWKVYESLRADLGSIGTLTSSYSSLMKAQIDSGKLSEKEIEKKKKSLKSLAEVQRAVGIAGVVADTASGITSIWQAYAKEKVANAQTAGGTGPAAAATYAALNTKSLISAIASTASLVATGTAQIASIRGNYISNTASLSSSSSGGESVAATPAIIDSTPYSYTRTLQTEEEEDEVNRPIYVTVTDIENGLNRARVVQNESTF